MYTSGTTGRPRGWRAARQRRHAPQRPPVLDRIEVLTATPVFTFAGLGFIYNPMKAV